VEFLRRRIFRAVHVLADVDVMREIVAVIDAHVAAEYDAARARWASKDRVDRWWSRRPLSGRASVVSTAVLTTHLRRLLHDAARRRRRGVGDRQARGSGMTRHVDSCLQCGHALVDHRPIPGEAATNPVRALECSAEGCSCHVPADDATVQPESPV
jgi:hypothetical protein